MGPFNATPEEDTKFGDYFVEISKTAKRQIRATSKTYSETGQYIFVKLFKLDKENKKSVLHQQISLTREEFELLVSHKDQILRQTPDNSSARKRHIDITAAGNAPQKPKRNLFWEDTDQQYIATPRINFLPSVAELDEAVTTTGEMDESFMCYPEESQRQDFSD